MTSYIIRRLIQAFCVLILVTLLVFLGMRLLPGDPIYMYLTAGQMQTVTEEQVEEARKEFGLDKPVMMQYFYWLAGIVHGDFGTSIAQRRPPLDMIMPTDCPLLSI